MWKKIAPLIALFALCFMPHHTEAYKDMKAKKISQNMKRYLDQRVKFKDRLLFIWKTQPLSKKDKSGYIKFETQNIRCIVRERDIKTIDFLRKRLKKSAPRYLTFYGSVVKKFEFSYYMEIDRVEFPKYIKKN